MEHNILQQFGELGLGSRLKRLSDVIMKDIQVVYDTLGIDFDPYLFPVFKLITGHKNITNAQIQEQLGYTQPAITQALQKLEHKKLISYKVDTTDKRKKLLRLTKKGVSLCEQMRPVWKAIDQQVKWLTEGSASSLTRHLTYLEDQLREKSLHQRILEHYQKHRHELY